MVWSANERIKKLVETTYTNQTDEQLIYLQHTKTAHSDDHIAATIILKQRAAKAETDREAREVERHKQMGVWIAELKRLHWTAWIMFFVGIASLLIAYLQLRAQGDQSGHSSSSPQVLEISPTRGP